MLDGNFQRLVQRQHFRADFNLHSIAEEIIGPTGHGQPFQVNLVRFLNGEMRLHIGDQRTLLCDEPVGRLVSRAPIMVRRASGQHQNARNPGEFKRQFVGTAPLPAQTARPPSRVALDSH